jgi:hypothetical protein
MALFLLHSFLEQRWQTRHPQLFLDAFSKFRKATVSFVFSVCMPVCLSVGPSVCMIKRDSHWMNFKDIWYLSISRKLVEEF